MLIFLPLVLLLCFSVYFQFANALKEVTRLSSVTTSPVIRHVSETIEGASTIRAYNKIKEFEAQQNGFQDVNILMNYYKRALRCWLNIRLAFISMAIFFITYLYCVSLF